MFNMLTCVYCGMEYPAETPASGSEVAILTNHIKVCEKHPMRQAEQKIVMLRTALVGLVGFSDKEELEKMEMLIRVSPVPMADKTGIIDAIHVLIATIEES